MRTHTAMRAGAIVGAAALQLLVAYWAVAGSMSAAFLAVAAVFLALIGCALGALAGRGIAGSIEATRQPAEQVEAYEERLAA